MLRGLGEAAEHAEDPEESEDEKGDDGVKKTHGIGDVTVLQVGLDGVFADQANQEEQGATVPGEPGTDEVKRRRAALGREPVFLVGDV